MKKIYFTSLIPLFLLIFTASSFAQANNDVKSTIGTIIEMSKTKNYEGAAKFVAFRPDDKKMEYKAPQLNSRDQMNYIKRLLKRIGALADVSSSFKIGEAVKQEITGVKFEKISVDFLSGSQKLNASFLFINIQGNYLLAEIE
mgnify:CR=1 FL=1